MIPKGHSGEKYLRWIEDAAADPVNEPRRCLVDVYAVLVAFGVTCPACAHAVKKILAAGQRGKGDRLADLTEARDALARAIQIEQGRKGGNP